MKTIALATIALLGTLGVAEAKSWGRPPVSASAYDYGREKKAGYKKDYCEDAIGNHIYCASAGQGSAAANGFTSTWQPAK